MMTKVKYTIQFKEIGKWWTIEDTSDIKYAIRIASFYAKSHGEDFIRIIDQNNNEVSSIEMEKRFDDEYQPPFNIEVFNLGYWESIDLLYNLEEALWVASSFVHGLDGLPEDRVRICDGNNNII